LIGRSKLEFIRNEVEASINSWSSWWADGLWLLDVGLSWGLQLSILVFLKVGVVGGDISVEVIDSRLVIIIDTLQDTNV